MVFGRLKARFGGGTSVETIVQTAAARPGDPVEGVVDIVGGDVEQEISYLELTLVANVQVIATDNTEGTQSPVVARQRIHDAFTLQPAERKSVPFAFGLPIDTPFNVIGDRRMQAVQVGIRTELEIAKSFDKGDFDAIEVSPLPAQERIIAAFERNGCQLRHSDLRGHFAATATPFYQRLEFAPPFGGYDNLTDLDVVLMAGSGRLDVLMVGERRPGYVDPGGDRAVRMTITDDAIDTEDWESIVKYHLDEVTRRRGFFG